MDTNALHGLIPLARTLGMRLENATKGEVGLAMDWQDVLCTSAGVLHGGALMSLADTAGAVCSFLNLPEGATTATIESKTNLLAAVRDGTVTAVSTPLHVGGRMIVVETAVTDEAGGLVAKTTQTQAVLRG